jgi:hypothetical protein
MLKLSLRRAKSAGNELDNDRSLRDVHRRTPLVISIVDLSEEQLNRKIGKSYNILVSLSSKCGLERRLHQSP